MTNAYRWVQWNKHKKMYDLILVGSVLVYLGVFMTISSVGRDGVAAADPAVSMMRALGSGALVLLHLILAIGPLTRIHRGFMPLLYNRRHMGVTMFVLALLHAFIATGYYGGFGIRNPLAAVLDPTGSQGVPYELLGFIAMMIISVMGVTSHDFWLKNLGASFWKTMHMGVYAAYVLLIGHVVFGALAHSDNSVWFIALSAGFVGLSTLHLLAAWTGPWNKRAPDVSWIPVCDLESIPIDRAARVTLNDGSRVAVFRHSGGVHAVSDRCAHQGGPLSEGKIVDGCITCPWHGYQYQPKDGCSPPPYTERIATYQVKIEGETVHVRTQPGQSDGSVCSDTEQGGEA